MTPPLYGLLAEFDRPTALLSAARAVRSAGYREIDAYTPYHLAELTEALGLAATRLPWLVLAGGLLGASLAYAMLWYSSVLDYPHLIAGRPFHSWPAFVPVTFEMGVLGATLAALFGTLIANRATELHHPLFGVDAFDRASTDRFFLCVASRDPLFDVERTRALLESQAALEVHDVAA